MQRFQVAGSRFHREYLELPTEFAEALGPKSEREPLFVKDLNGQSYLAEWYPVKRLLGGLGRWYRTNNVKPTDDITIEVSDPVERTLRIWVEKQGEEARPTGLYLGKVFNTVGLRRMELGRPFHLPVSDLLTHCFICGVTGSGKTVLAKAIVEEAALQGIPSVLIDLKGDLSSLAVRLQAFEAKEFEPWAAGKDSAERREVAREESERHAQKLGEFGLSLEDAGDFFNRTVVRVFTPRSRKGIPLAIASLLAAPDGIDKTYWSERETYDALLRSLADAFTDRLYPGARRSRIENERVYLHELISWAWLHGENLEGEKGLLRLLELAQNPPFKQIGGLPVEKYIDAENRRARLLNKINTLLTGPERGWFEGQAFVPQHLLEQVDGRTPINIINLTELDHYEDRTLVVYHITSQIQNWMRRLPGTTEPRCLFLVDEIGGGGGKQALFPSYPYESAAKWGLNYLLRQGRAFGVCCVFATQNPGDVDYKGLSNCGTWMVGKLAVERDRNKVLEGMAVMGFEEQKVKHNLTSAGVGDFVIRDIRGEVSYLRQRWLYSYHRVLTLAEVQRLEGEGSGDRHVRARLGFKD